MTSAPAVTAVSPAAKQDFRFVARQPILDGREQVFGYELLFRDGIENFFRGTDIEAAARNTVDSTLLMGFDVLCDGQRAFLNCTRDLLLEDGVMLLPPSQAVVEVLESVAPDDLVVEACGRLRAAGYTVALDDYVANDPRESLVHVADILKVDFNRTTVAERAALAKRHGGAHCVLLAEKVETRQQFTEARDMGFVYFQGYFFRRPEVLKAREIPANQLNYLRLLEAVSRPEMDIRELEDHIKREASVLYRLLRYLNSPLFAFATEIHSVRHALAILGEREARRWIRLVVLVSAGLHKSSDLVLSALVRARFCELLSPRIGKVESDLFLVGLVSMMDVILEMPMAQVVEKIALDQDTRAVLTGGEGVLQPVYRLMLAQEVGAWEQARESAAVLHISESDAAQLWWRALEWARQVSSGR